MSIQNFVPEIWATGILKERDKAMIGAKHCTTEYEGQIKRAGDRVKILTVGTVNSYVYNKNTDINDPDIPNDAAQYLDIDQMKYCHVFLDDVDKVQANENLMGEYQRQIGLTMANDVDTFIFGKYTDAGETLTENATSANIINILAEAAQVFKENNVPEGETKYLEVSPAIYTKLILARIAKETMNTKVIDGATVPIIYGFEVYVSNNIPVVEGAHKCLARTKKAIAYASQITETKAYEPPKRFGNAIKALQVWGGKTIRPKELVCLNLTPGPEA